ncbi:MAG: baseplate assembly protein [Proteobacteria bacterium]|nr:baseplate assembly protein [Pseudomonadota bacterium]
MSGEVYGQDIRLGADFQALVAANGELVLSDGVQTGEQDVRLRLFTRLGTLFYDVNFGSLIHDWIHDENTSTNRLGLASELAVRVALDSRVEPGTVVSSVLSWNETGLVIQVAWTFIDEDHPSNLVLEVGEDGTISEVLQDVATD